MLDRRTLPVRLRAELADLDASLGDVALPDLIDKVASATDRLKNAIAVSNQYQQVGYSAVLVTLWEHVARRFLAEHKETQPERPDRSPATFEPTHKPATGKGVSDRKRP